MRTQDRPLIGLSNCRSLRKLAFSKARVATEPVRLANEDVDVDCAIGDVRKDYATLTRRGDHHL